MTKPAKNNLSIGGGVRLTVNGDAGRVICFDPEDVEFAARFYELVQKTEAKAARLAEAEEALAGQAQSPALFAKRLALAREACAFLRGQIDDVFGPGTAEAAFGGANSLAMFSQFFAGIAPHIAPVRKGKVQKYLAGGGDNAP